jgi:hypothetical protein
MFLVKKQQIFFRLAQRLSQTSTQATFSNVNPAHALPYASPIQTQLGRQSTATPRHPKCILDLDGKSIRKIFGFFFYRCLLF